MRKLVDTAVRDTVEETIMMRAEAMGVRSKLTTADKRNMVSVEDMAIKRVANMEEIIEVVGRLVRGEDK